MAFENRAGIELNIEIRGLAPSIDLYHDGPLTQKSVAVTLIMKISVYFLALGLSLLVSCSSLPVPSGSADTGTGADALAVLKRSAAKSAHPWQRYRQVKVSYSGEWSNLATRLQPILTDPGFRKGSVETYQPRSGRVRQFHTGPQGTKEVTRQGSKTVVVVNGKVSNDGQVTAAAALVADAYTAFLFGPSWLVGRGSDLSLLAQKSLGGERCTLVAGKLSPGIGSSAADYFIAWIGDESGLMRRFQFSLNALDSTRGADVEVTFSDHWKAADGSIWPGHFIETIERPILTKAHDWRLTGLRLGERKMR